MARDAYLVSYDIADDKRRNRIHDTLLDYGDHLQFSVFLCELNRTELVALRTQLQDTVNVVEDQVLLLHIGAPPTLESALATIGKPRVVMARVQVV